MKYFIFIFILYIIGILCPSGIIAQNKLSGKFNFDVKLVDEKGLMEDVITVKLDNNNMIEARMCRDGRISFEFEAMGDYILILKKSGYIPSLIYVSTHMNPADLEDLWGINETKIKLGKEDIEKDKWEQNLKLIKYEWSSEEINFKYRYIFVNNDYKSLLLENIFSNNLKKVKTITKKVIDRHEYIKLSKYARDSVQQVIRQRDDELRNYRTYIGEKKEEEYVLKKTYLISKSIEDQHFFESIKDQELRYKEELKSWRYTINRIEDEVNFKLIKIDRLGHELSYIALNQRIISLKTIIGKKKFEFKTDSLELVIKNAEIELELEKSKVEYKRALASYKESKQIYQELLADAPTKIKAEELALQHQKPKSNDISLNNKNIREKDNSPSVITYSSIIPSKTDNKDMFVDTYKLNETPHKLKTRKNNKAPKNQVPSSKFVTSKNNESSSVELESEAKSSIKDVEKLLVKEKFTSSIAEESLTIDFLKEKIRSFDIVNIDNSEDSIININLIDGFKYIDIPIKFEGNQFKLSMDDASKIDMLVDFLNDNYSMDLEVRGFADVGFINNNQKELGAKRALAVKRYLMKKGIEESRLNSIPFPTKIDEVSRINEITYRYNHYIELRIKGNPAQEDLLKKKLKVQLARGDFIRSAKSISSIYEDELIRYKEQNLISQKQKETLEDDNISSLIDQEIQKDMEKAKQELEEQESLQVKEDDDDFYDEEGGDISFDDLKKIHEKELEKESIYKVDNNKSSYDTDDFDLDEAMLEDQKLDKLIISSPPKFKIGGSLGFTMFYGDITSSFLPLFDTRVAMSLDAIKPISKLLDIQAQLMTGYISGSNKNINVGADAPKGIYFRTAIMEACVHLHFNVTKVFIDEHNDLFDKFQIFAGLGHGVVKFNTTLKMSHTDLPILQYQKGSSGKTTEMITPLTFKLQHTINHNLDLSYNFNIRNVNTDKMDGWVEVGSSRDKYLFLSVTALYKIRDKYFVKTMQSIKSTN